MPPSPRKFFLATLFLSSAGLKIPVVFMSFLGPLSTPPPSSFSYLPTCSVAFRVRSFVSAQSIKYKSAFILGAGAPGVVRMKVWNP